MNIQEQIFKNQCVNVASSIIGQMYDIENMKHEEIAKKILDMAEILFYEANKRKWLQQ